MEGKTFGRRRRDKRRRIEIARKCVAWEGQERKTERAIKTTKREIERQKDGVMETGGWGR